MNIEDDESWKKSVAQGIAWLVVGIGLTLLVTNLVSFVLPIAVGVSIRDMEARRAAMQLGMAWVGVIAAVQMVPLVVGTWKGTPPAALAPGASVPWFRLGLRGLALTYSGLLAVLVALRFVPNTAYRSFFTRFNEAIWWCFVLLGLEYIRRVFLRLERTDAATRIRWAGCIYLLLVVLSIGLPALLESIWPELTGDNSPTSWALTPVLVPIVLAIVAFVLLTCTLWPLRRSGSCT